MHLRVTSRFLFEARFTKLNVCMRAFVKTSMPDYIKESLYAIDLSGVKVSLYVITYRHARLDKGALLFRGVFLQFARLMRSA